MTLAVLLISVFQISVSAASPTLDARERDSLRYKLEDHFNELDLMIKNQGTEGRDVERQKREIENLKVLERIPLKEKIPELRKELTESAKEHAVAISGFQRRGLSKTSKVPARIFSDERYRMSPDDTAQEIRFSVVATGESASVDKWVVSLPTEQMRLVNVEKKQEIAPGKFKILAHAFRFRPMEFPKIEIRDPVLLLPEWARKNPDAFAKSEPLLWKFISQSRELAPKAAPLYSNRRQFLLNSARMAYFISKAVPKGSHRH